MLQIRITLIFKTLYFWLPFLSFGILSAQKAELSKEFHKNNRQQLREKLPNNSVAVYFSAPVRNRANDVDFEYHQDPNFYYLTGWEEPHAVLLVYNTPQTDEQGTYLALIMKNFMCVIEMLEMRCGMVVN